MADDGILEKYLEKKDFQIDMFDSIKTHRLSDHKNVLFQDTKSKNYYMYPTLQTITKDEKLGYFSNIFHGVSAVARNGLSEKQSENNIKCVAQCVDDNRPPSAWIDQESIRWVTDELKKQGKEAIRTHGPTVITAGFFRCFELFWATLVNATCCKGGRVLTYKGTCYLAPFSLWEGDVLLGSLLPLGEGSGMRVYQDSTDP